jgi:hypothetical protein
VVSKNITIAHTVSTRLLCVLSAVAARLIGLGSAAEGEAVVRPAIEEALEELANLGVVLAGPKVRRRNGDAAQADGP